MEQRWTSIEGLMRACTVRIKVGGDLGTGFFVAPGLVLTCAHVVEVAKSSGAAITVHWRVTESASHEFDGEIKHFFPKPYPDLALIELTSREPSKLLPEHPCVRIDPAVQVGDAVWSFGYPLEYAGGDSALFEFEGPAWKINESAAENRAHEYLRLKLSQATGGFSGAPLLNLRTRSVCGILKMSRDLSSDLGGRGVSASTILQCLPSLNELQRDYHARNEMWAIAGCARTVAPVYVVPAPVGDFVPRPDVTDSVKSWLLRDAANARRPVLLLHGLPGSGKTKLALELANDPDVQRRFVGGVLWTTLGQEPELLSLLLEWIEALEPQGVRAQEVPSASRELAKLLRRRPHTLLVIDDVWEADHLEPFVVAVPQCRLLVTARRAHVARESNIVPVEVGPMSPEQSLVLLRSRIGEAWDEAQCEAAMSAASVLGHLPAALDLLASRIRRGDDWNTLVAQFEGEVARLEALESGRDRRLGESRLEGMVNVSLRSVLAEDRATYDTFVWMGVLMEDADITIPAVARLRGVSEFDAADMLEFLREDSLLMPAPSSLLVSHQGRAYRMHDVLRHVARRRIPHPPEPSDPAELPGLGLSLPEAHRTFIARLRRLAERELLHTLTDDGYSHQHAALHLERGEIIDQLHHLLAEETTDGRNGWFEIRERLRQTAGYIADVIRAQTHLAATGTDAEAGLRCRYALMLASLNSIAGSIPSALVARLVELGEWSPQQGLAYIMRMSAGEQNRALAAMVRHLSQPMLLHLLGERQGAKSDFDWRWVQRVGQLAPWLEEPAKGSALRGAVTELVRDYNLYDVMANSAVEWLVPAPLPADLLRELFRHVLAVKDDFRRYQQLKALAPVLPAELVIEGLDLAPDATPVLARQLAVLGQAADAFAAVVRNQTKVPASRVADALVLLAPHLDEILISKALVRANKLEDPAFRAEALIAGARALGRLGHADEMLQWVTLALRPEELAFDRDVWWARAVVAIGPFLQPDAQADALTQARDQKGYNRDRLYGDVVEGLAPFLPNTLARDTLHNVEQIGDKFFGARARTALLVRIARLDGIGGVWNEVAAIPDSNYRAETLVALADQLDEAVMDSVLAFIEALDSDEHRAIAINGIAARLPARYAIAALHLVRGVRDQLVRLDALVELAPLLTESQLDSVLHDIAAAKDAKPRSRWLASVAPHLPERCLRRAVEIAFATEASPDYSAVEAVAQHLPASVWPELLRKARGAADDRRASLLEYIASAAPDEPAAAELLSATAELPEGERVDITLHVALRLADLHEHKHALHLVEEMSREPTRGVYLADRALKVLAPELTSANLDRAAHIVRELLKQCPDASVDAAAALAGRMALVGNGTEALDLLHAVRRGVEEVLAPRSDGSRRISIPDLTSWPESLASVAARGGTAVTDDVLALARWTPHRWLRAQALARVASASGIALPESELSELLDDKGLNVVARASALAKLLPALAPLISESRREHLINSTFAELRESIKPDDWTFLTYFVHLAPWWPADTVADAINWAVRGGDQLRRSEALGALLRRLIGVSGPADALRIIRENPWRRDSGAIMKAITDQLPVDALGTAFAVSLELRGDSRAQAIAALAPRLAVLGRAEIASLLQQLVAAEAQQKRPELIQTLAAFAPALANSGQQQTVVELATAIQNVARWWP